MNHTPKRPRDIQTTLAALDIRQADIPNADKENLNVDHLVADVHSALTTKQRISALHRLLKSLQNNTSTLSSANDRSFASSAYANLSQNVHDKDSARSVFVHPTPSSLIRAGIINPLSLQLHHLVHMHGSTAAEVELVCHCLSLLFGHARRKGDSFQRRIVDQGSPFVIILADAVSVVARKRRSRTTKSNIPSTRHSVLSIYHLLSTFAAGASLLFKCQGALETVIRCLVDNELRDESLLEALGIWKNLTYFQEDSRMYLLKATEFRCGLTSLPSRDLSIKSRQRLSSVIRNLAISVECRPVLVGHCSVIGAMVRLMMWEPESEVERVSIDFCNTRRNLLNTIVSLSMDHHSALLLIFHGDGILLTIFKHYLKESTDSVVRKRSACTLRLLANESSAPLLIHDAELMRLLSDAALRDGSIEVRKEAAEAFARCAALVQVEDQPHYAAVLDALTDLVTNRHRLNSVSVEVLARALKEQSCHIGNRLPMAERSVLLQTLAQIALDSTSTRATQDACSALLNLSCEPLNLERLVRCSCILDALTTNAASAFQNSDILIGDHTSTMVKEKGLAIATLVNLSALPRNRRVMAKHRCLLQTMIQVTRLMDKEKDVEKEMLKNSILLLVKELQL